VAETTPTRFRDVDAAVFNNAAPPSASDFPHRDAPFAPSPSCSRKAPLLVRAAKEAALQQGAEMNTSTTKTPPAAAKQREALKASEKKASEKQPGSFKEEATDDKIVKIPPTGPNKKPIRGLDSK
jgi:hypothetical protein